MCNNLKNHLLIKPDINKISIILSTTTKEELNSIKMYYPHWMAESKESLLIRYTGSR